jgi:hypothetical protein
VGATEKDPVPPLHGGFVVPVAAPKALGCPMLKVNTPDEQPELSIILKECVPAHKPVKVCDAPALFVKTVVAEEGPVVVRVIVSTPCPCQDTSLEPLQKPLHEG